MVLWAVSCLWIASTPSIPALACPPCTPFPPPSVSVRSPPRFAATPHARLVRAWPTAPSSSASRRVPTYAYKPTTGTITGRTRPPSPPAPSTDARAGVRHDDMGDSARLARVDMELYLATAQGAGAKVLPAKEVVDFIVQRARPRYAKHGAFDEWSTETRVGAGPATSSSGADRASSGPRACWSRSPPSTATRAPPTSTVMAVPVCDGKLGWNRVRDRASLAVKRRLGTVPKSARRQGQVLPLPGRPITPAWSARFGLGRGERGEPGHPPPDRAPVGLRACRRARTPGCCQDPPPV